jgi:hypothetical protein
MVGTDRVEVERQLRAGRLGCPSCVGVLAPWGYARERTVRGEGELVERLRPRRGCCGSCGRSHVLLPVSCLVRRADRVVVIGAALAAKAAGGGHRSIARRLGRPATTVRGWLRAFAGCAERVRVALIGLLTGLDPLAGPVPPAGTAFADAVAAVGVVAAAARRRLGGTVVDWSPWQLACAVCGGRLLRGGVFAESINTSWPWARPP